MQIDMHYYGVYALARAAGVGPDEARLIAHSSQFVDDSLEDEHYEVKQGQSAILPTMTSHKPTDFKNLIPGDQWKVWVPFHFLPGNVGKTFEERMICRLNSAPANEMLDFALQQRKETWGPYSAGIAMHVFADTFAHWGFIGFSSDYNKVLQDSIKNRVKDKTIKAYVSRKWELFKNKVMGSGAEAASSLGHAAVATFPDRPYLVWSFEYEPINGKRKAGKTLLVNRNNPRDFLSAAKLIHEFFRKYNSSNNKGRSWNSIKNTVRDILILEDNKEERCDAWRNAIGTSALFNSRAEDRNVVYDEKLWRFSHIDFLLAATGATVPACELSQFYKAAWMHRNFVLRDLLPRHGLIG